MRWIDWLIAAAVILLAVWSLIRSFRKNEGCSRQHSVYGIPDEVTGALCADCPAKAKCRIKKLKEIDKEAESE